MSELSTAKEIDLAVHLGPLILKNPVTVASGTFGYGLEFAEHMDLNRLGAIFVKGLTLKPRWGHPQPRIIETPAGMLNCIGLQNIGVDDFIKGKVPKLKQYSTSIIANINGSSIEEYCEVSSKLDACDAVAAIEINISCPNVKEGGISFGTDAGMSERVTAAVRSTTELPLIVKLTPNVTDIVGIAKAAINGGADAVSLINTLLGMAIDSKTRKPMLSNVTGGLSGPAIKPVALRCVWEVYRSLHFPILGMGGICTGQDAIEFMIAGASAVSVGTSNFIKPSQSITVLDEMIDFCKNNGIAIISEITGSLNLNTTQR